MTSRFARLSVTKQVTAIVILSLLPMFLSTNVAAAQTEQNKNAYVFDIKNVPVIPSVHQIQKMGADNSNDEQATPEPIDPITINAPILQDYLVKKGSPLAPYATQILQNENWKLVLAISNGESTLCKHQIYNNCWGVGGAWNMRHYATFAEGFADVNRFLTAKYVAKGADTPAEIVNKYVGHPNANWVSAVNKILTEVNNLPLVN